MVVDRAGGLLHLPRGVGGTPVCRGPGVAPVTEEGQSLPRLWLLHLTSDGTRPTHTGEGNGLDSKSPDVNVGRPYKTPSQQHGGCCRTAWPSLPDT